MAPREREQSGERKGSVPEPVRLWRPPGGAQPLFIHGVTRSYRVDPVGESVVGIIVDGAMVARRGGERHTIGPGELCAWDASARHEGLPHACIAWEARLIILDAPTLEDLALDPEGARRRVTLPGPRIADHVLAEEFLRLHRASERGASALHCETGLVEWLQKLAERGGAGEHVERSHARNSALRRACERLADDPSANVTLGELARVAGVSRHRLTRLFRAALGVPPHRYQLAQRLRLARALLEQGMPAAEAAVRAGFADQSHLHRHFRRALGFTPARYAAQLRSNVQDARHQPE